jgi:hypothetical protein
MNEEVKASRNQHEKRTARIWVDNANLISSTCSARTVGFFVGLAYGHLVRKKREINQMALEMKKGLAAHNIITYRGHKISINFDLPELNGNSIFIGTNLNVPSYFASERKC